VTRGILGGVRGIDERIAPQAAAAFGPGCANSVTELMPRVKYLYNRSHMKKTSRDVFGVLLAVLSSNPGGPRKKEAVQQKRPINVGCTFDGLSQNLLRLQFVPGPTDCFRLQMAKLLRCGVFGDVRQVVSRIAPDNEVSSGGVSSRRLGHKVSSVGRFSCRPGVHCRPVPAVLRRCKFLTSPGRGGLFWCPTEALPFTTAAGVLRRGHHPPSPVLRDTSLLRRSIVTLGPFSPLQQQRAEAHAGGHGIVGLMAPQHRPIPHHGRWGASARHWAWTRALPHNKVHRRCWRTQE
jgi:hypothetical protein